MSSKTITTLELLATESASNQNLKDPLAECEKGRLDNWLY